MLDCLFVNSWHWNLQQGQTMRLATIFKLSNILKLLDVNSFIIKFLETVVEVSTLCQSIKDIQQKTLHNIIS